MSETKRLRDWQHVEPYKAVLIVKDARRADIIAVTPSDYAWDRPFDLHLFIGDTSDSELERFVLDYGDEWRFVDFSWVVSNVDFIDHCITH